MVSDVTATGRENAHGARATQGWNGLPTLVEQIQAAGGTASWVCGDVSSEADAARLVQDTLTRHGRLDILVNNAAAPQGADRADIEKVPLQAWEDTMAINVRGVFLMSRAAIGPMRRQRWGRIINISSAVARHPLTNRTAYGASKAAVIGFTQCLALDVAPAGITVNAVCPGSTITSRFRSTVLRSGFTDEDTAMRETAAGIPLSRHGLPDEMAATIVFLASDGAAYMTGQSLFVDGGGMPRHRA